MASRKNSSCFKCGNLGHIAENCSSEQRLCYNCRQPGHESAACPSPRTVAAKQCYSCGGVGHIQADCPTLRIQQQSGGQKCYNCGRFGHIAKICPVGNPVFTARPPLPGRALNTSTLPLVRCYRCGGPNHVARDCLAPPGDDTAVKPKSLSCYRCKQEGHISRDCPENAEYVHMLCISRLPRVSRRHLFSLPNFLPSELQTYQEHKRLPYTQQQLYNVVSDVASYRHFIPFCSSSHILSSTDPTKTPLLLEAELTVQFLAFKESYVSQVTCTPLESVEAVASSSTPLFKQLKTTWRFKPDGRATIVSLDLALENDGECV
ncbi:hypothetical protein MIND_00729400 [Mycena indigotica]|uniref:CCHC-type domain-containing protein n=1 Tax=Mycena indigotica TaxID=2126181 RepID=A0A8H6SLP9_9AGAR|nr:uncharacterized protein MIND_00729400 [Mycena indigotica]KAF7301639.1 hypothetical protein MIND_00729400 [Mycena indigotica]